MPLRAGAAADAGASAAASTSSLLMTPSGPVPRMRVMSTPRSLARRRALGEILGPPSAAAAVSACAGVEVGAAARGCSVVFRAAGAVVGESAGGCSPGFTIHAIVMPTWTTSPSCDLTPARTPSAAASTSTTALSVSTSSSGSPLLIVSPSFFNQETIFPVSCAISRAGITTLFAIMSYFVLLIERGLKPSTTLETNVIPELGNKHPRIGEQRHPRIGNNVIPELGTTSSPNWGTNVIQSEE